MRKKIKSHDIDGLDVLQIVAAVLKVIATGILFFSLGLIVAKIFIG